MLVVPFMIGGAMAKSFRMADYGWKIGLILLAVCAGFYIDILMWPPHLGIDLSGGVKLIYQIDQSKLRDVNIDKLIRIVSDEALKAGYGNKKPEVVATGDRNIEIRLPSTDPDKARIVEENIGKLDLLKGQQALGITLEPLNRREEAKGIVLVYRMSRAAETVKMDDLVKAISQRVNPGGQREVSIRTVGSQEIEVAIPNVDKAEIDLIKRKIATAGALEFRIVADRQVPDDAEALELAEKEINNPANEVGNGERIVALGRVVRPRHAPAQLAAAHHARRDSGARDGRRLRRDRRLLGSRVVRRERYG